MWVIVLDDSSDVDSVQLNWLASQLAFAKAHEAPAIVVGDADLNAQIQNGDTAAAAVAQVLAGGHASAYFYDAPEENVQRPLLGSRSSLVRLGHARVCECGERTVWRFPRRERVHAGTGRIRHIQQRNQRREGQLPG